MDGQDWHRAEAVDVPDDGRVRSVVVDGRTVALARCGLQLGALDNRCPHQGGPLGEGSIEGGWLRCPWHGYDYDPVTGRPPEGFADGVTAYEVQERTDGMYVRLPNQRPPVRTVGDVLVETLVAFGVRHVFGMVGHSNLGFADAMRRAEQRGELTYIGIRHEGAAIKHVLLDNHALGKIAKEQRAGGFPVWHTSLVSPDWAAYARLCGAKGIRVERRDELDAAMAELFAVDGPALLCVEQDPELL